MQKIKVDVKKIGVKKAATKENTVAHGFKVSLVFITA